MWGNTFDPDSGDPILSPEVGLPPESPDKPQDSRWTTLVVLVREQSRQVFALCTPVVSDNRSGLDLGTFSPRPSILGRQPNQVSPRAPIYEVIYTR